MVLDLLGVGQEILGIPHEIGIHFVDSSGPGKRLTHIGRGIG
jgi:hypothetical protein